MPKISIIVPVYKVEKYLRRCIDSILVQTFRDFELLLIDDGSPDNSGAICDEYAEKDPRVQVFHNENGGVSSARNCGLDHAQGTYIMFCDSDDYVAEAWIEKLYQVMQQDSVEFGLCGYTSVSDSTGEVIEQVYHPGPDISAIPQSDFWTLHNEKLINMPWNKIFLKKKIENLSLRFKVGVQYGEDEMFVLTYLLSCNGPLGVCADCLNHYVHGIAGSLTKRYVKSIWEIFRENFKLRNAVIKKSGNSPESIKESYYSKWIWCILRSINNNMMENSHLRFWEMFRENQKILSSKECKLAFANGKFTDLSTLYTFILKSRCFLLILLFHKLSHLKHKLIPNH